MSAAAEPGPILTALFDQIENVRQEIKTVREAVIRMETQGYGVQIEELRRDSRETREKVIVIETKGRMAAGVVAACVSVGVMVAGSLIMYALGMPAIHGG